MTGKHYLFVYGTLRRNLEYSMSHWLSRHAHFVDNGFTYGRLYEINHYPGMIRTTSGYEKVYGEVYRIDNPEYVLKILDGYEECSTPKHKTQF